MRTSLLSTLALRLLMATPAIAAAPPSALDATLAALDLSGDLRLREELDLNRENSSGDDQLFRQRPRVRFRIGAKLQVAEELRVVARLVTGSVSDAKSSHQTLGIANAGLMVSFDRVYLSYTPAWAPGLSFAAGKQPSPLVSSGVYGELVHDGDVQPSGFTARYTSPAFGPVTVFGAVGEYILLEQSKVADVHATVGQLGARFALGTGTSLTAAAEVHAYWDPSAAGATALVAQSRGQATVDDDGDGQADRYASDFTLVQSFVTVKASKLPLPVVVSAGVLSNIDADEDGTGCWSRRRGR